MAFAFKPRGLKADGHDRFQNSQVREITRMPTTSNRRKPLSKWALIFACWTFLALLFSGPQMIQAIRLNRTAEGWNTVLGELIFSYLWLG